MVSCRVFVVVVLICFSFSRFSLLVFFLNQAEGEAVVKEAFPEATIVRPAKLFGNDDRLLTWMATLGMKISRVPMVNELFRFGVCATSVKRQISNSSLRYWRSCWYLLGVGVVAWDCSAIL